MSATEVVMVTLALITATTATRNCFTDPKVADNLSRRYQLCTLSTENELRSGNSVDWISENSARMCILLQMVINRCTPIYRSCFDRRAFESFQDSQIEIFLQASTQIYNSRLFQMPNCRVVQRFLKRKSLSRLKSGSPSHCSSESADAALSSYNKCTNQISGEVKRDLASHVQNKELHQRLFCNGLFKAVYGCALILKDCYDEDEIISRVRNQKQLLRKIFQVKHWAEQNVTLSLEQCSVYGGVVGESIHSQQPRSMDFNSTSHVSVNMMLTLFVSGLVAVFCFK